MSTNVRDDHVEIRGQIQSASELWHAGKYEASNEVLFDTISKYSATSHLAFLIGRNFASMQYDVEAEQWLLESQSFTAPNEWSYFELARVMHRKGDFDEALRAMGNFLHQIQNGPSTLNSLQKQIIVDTIANCLNEAKPNARADQSRYAIISIVKSETGMTVQTGPFSGMQLHDVQTWGPGSDIGPQLLGIYEQELHDSVTRFVARRPQCIVNVGCAEGYYAVGLSRLLPEAVTSAFDIDLVAQETCKANASLNSVHERLNVLGACSSDILTEISKIDPRILAVIDCEGHERELLTTGDSVKALRLADLIVEVHEDSSRDTLAMLIGSFNRSHRLSIVRSSGRDPYAFPFLDRFSDAEKWLLVCENRPETQVWLICESQGLADAGRRSGLCRSPMEPTEITRPFRNGITESR